MESVSTTVERALASLKEWLDTNAWTGRERELVSLFAFSHLAPLAHPSKELASQGQIAIEVGVRQTLAGPRRHKYVCKDLVIWAQPCMTCWNDRLEPVNSPLAILEWKRPGYRIPLRSHAPVSNDRHDLDWLRSYIREYPNCIGYSILLAKTISGEQLNVLKFCNGRETSVEIAAPPHHAPSR